MNLNFSPKISFSIRSVEINEYQNTKLNFNRPDNQDKCVQNFDNFITDKTNDLAYSSSLKVAIKPSKVYNPLFLYSKLSLGKTHLLKAIYNYISDENPLLKSKYISADTFSKKFSVAKKNNQLIKFRESYLSLDILLMDDIHLLSGKKKTQEELILLFNSFYSLNKQIVLAGTNTPNKIQGIIPQFQSCLECGLLSEIQVPDQKTKINILKKLAQNDNFIIPGDVILFLSNSTNDLKQLTQSLINIEAKASMNNNKIDITLVKSTLTYRSLKEISVPYIQNLVAEYFNVSLSNLISNKKKRSLSYPRQVAMYLSRQYTKLSFEQIGKLFGNKDHSTVIYAVKRVKKEMLLKKEIMNDVNTLQDLLK